MDAKFFMQFPNVLLLGALEAVNRWVQDKQMARLCMKKQHQGTYTRLAVMTCFISVVCM